METYPDHNEKNAGRVKCSLGWYHVRRPLREIQGIDGHEKTFPPLRPLGLGCHGRNAQDSYEKAV